MRIVGLDRRLDFREVERAVGTIVERLRLDRAQHRHAARLVVIRVRVLAHDHLLAALAMRHERREVRLRPGGKEESRLHAEALRGDLLQAVHPGIVAEDVAADGGLRHRGAHGGRRLGNGVASKVYFQRRLSFSFSSAALPGQSSRSASWLSGSATVLSDPCRSRGLEAKYKRPVTISPIA